MEALFHNLASLRRRAHFPNIFYCLMGAAGTLIGVLRHRPVATIAMLLRLRSPSTRLPLIMLAGIYYGAQYGGSTTAIWSTFRRIVPVVTCLDGYRWPTGQAARARIAAIGSFFAGASPR